MSDSRKPVLSLILCSRNDAYMGDSRWRLETTLNYIGAEIAAIGAGDKVEIVVCDWGSDHPLREAVALDPLASGVVSFVTVPPDLALKLQHDSPFPEVIALNAAARRARGEFIGRIDQDTLVGRRFLKTFLQWVEEGKSPVRAPLDGALWFSCRRSIPYRLAVKTPHFDDIVRLIRWFGGWLDVEIVRTFYCSSVGIWLLHRDLWDESGGYDERMIYMNDMEIDMATRLMIRYPMVDLGKLVGYDFYHLDHYHPRGPRSSSAHRQVNSQSPRESVGFRPSGALWGLGDIVLPMDRVTWCRHQVSRSWWASAPTPRFLLKALWVAARTAVDRVWYQTWPLFRQRWTRRATLGWQAVTGQPLVEWPARLRRAWNERPSAKAQQ